MAKLAETEVYGALTINGPIINSYGKIFIDEEEYNSYKNGITLNEVTEEKNIENLSEARNIYLENQDDALVLQGKENLYLSSYNKAVVIEARNKNNQIQSGTSDNGVIKLIAPYHLNITTQIIKLNQQVASKGKYVSLINGLCDRAIELKNNVRLKFGFGGLNYDFTDLLSSSHEIPEGSDAKVDTTGGFSFTISHFLTNPSRDENLFYLPIVKDTAENCTYTIFTNWKKTEKNEQTGETKQTDQTVSTLNFNNITKFIYNPNTIIDCDKLNSIKYQLSQETNNPILSIKKDSVAIGKPLTLPAISNVKFSTGTTTKTLLTYLNEKVNTTYKINGKALTENSTKLDLRDILIHIDANKLTNLVVPGLSYKNDKKVNEPKKIAAADAQTIINKLSYTDILNLYKLLLGLKCGSLSLSKLEVSTDIDKAKTEAKKKDVQTKLYKKLLQ